MIYNVLMEKSKLSETKFEIFQEIADAIAATDNISAIANLMIDLAVRYVDAEEGSLMLLNECDELYILAARGIDIRLINTYRAKIGEGIAGVVARDRTPVLVQDIDKSKVFKKSRRDRYKTKSFISCPIVRKNTLFGVLSIADKKDGSPFTDDEFALLKVIANQAAVALENAFLMNQLRAKAAELEEINRKLIDSDVMKTEFLTRVSHELRTPLNAVKGAIYYLQQAEKVSRTQQKEFFDIISGETDQLIDLVENQLNFIRLEDETQMIKKSLIDLPDLLREVLGSTLLKPSLARKNLCVTVDIKGSISNIVGDKIKLAQLFINLIEELSHHLMQGDSIGISVHENEYVEVTLTFPRKLPEMHLAFFNSMSILQAGQSEGRLKLYLAWKIAEYHRWDLRGENRGEAFSVSIAIPKSTRQKTEAIIGSAMEVFIEFVSELLDLNTCSIMLSDELTGELTIKGARGLDDSLVKRTRIRFGDRIAGWVALEGEPLLIDDIESDPRFGQRSISQYNTKSLLSIPLKINNKVIGVINLNNKKTAEPFTSQDLDVASVLGERISSFIEKLYSGEYREDTLKHSFSSFEGLLNAVKKYHKKRSPLPEFVLKIMESLGADREDRRIALYVSRLYDLGLMVIDDCIINKEKLLVSDARILKAHPRTTISLLDGFEISEDVKKAILHHHERYDGTGYPDQLKGEEIPFISRVLTVVDAFCAMLEDRPYRKAMTKEEALKEIESDSGSVYDPKIIAALRQVLENAG